MAKTRAPLLSLEASGSLAKVLVMSRGRRQPYTKYFRKPKDPKTAKQLGRRAWFQGLATSWSLLPQASKDTWSNLERETYLSNYNAYLRYNLQHIDRGEMPTAKYPWGGVELNSAPVLPTPLPGPRHVDLEYWLGEVRYGWLFLIYRDIVASYDTTTDKLILAITVQDLDHRHYIDTPLEPDQYWYRVRSVTTDGNNWTKPGSVGATVLPS